MDTATRFRQTVIAWAAGARATPAPAEAGAARDLAAGLGLHTVVLVEGVSDRAAVEALAERQGRTLTAEGVVVVPLGGTTSITRFLRLLGPDGLDVRPAGPCDAAEQRFFRQGLERTGFGTARAPDDLETLGFLTRHADLEDELIHVAHAEPGRCGPALREQGDAAGEVGARQGEGVDGPGVPGPGRHGHGCRYGPRAAGPRPATGWTSRCRSAR
ncbi:ATP-dependent endonuclease [Streptomyces anulatus]|uniref:ATP-dependent endonuclease n=1 Tax=Streptomyces anulatus TaxID=1892 RepID=UPI000AE9A663|nr:ATP-dependent endonuclease [Streptomyces anulatus]